MTAHDVQTAATAPETGAVPEPAHGAEIVVPLNRLKASPRNARKVKHSAAAIEALAASIRAKGVLQAPVVEIERDREGATTGNYLVTIGEGRRQALRMLVKRKAIMRTHPVKVVVDTLNDAHEISLDENITREAMHPADQFEAFRKLAAEKGYGPEEIGARFGVSAHVVRQRLRLGAAAPELMAAYREGTVTLDLLTAFCVSEDQDRQRQVLQQMGPYTSVFAIRRAMTEAKVRADDRRVGFVGIEAYETEGGAVLRDLFTEDGGGWLEDPALLDRLVSEKLTALAREGTEPDEGLAPLSERLLIDLTAHKTMGLRDAVQADVAAALATVVHAMALQVIYPGYGDFTPLQLRLSAGELERLAPGVGDSPAGRRVTDRLEAWGARLPERAEDLWEVLASMRRGDLLDLLACCAGVGLHAVRDPHDRRPGAWAQAEALATAVGLDMTGTWCATAASYFSRVPKARVLAAVTEAVGAEEAGRIAGFKKGDMADAAERLLEGRGWLPPVLRTAEALQEEPAPEGDGEDGPPLSLEEACGLAAE